MADERFCDICAVTDDSRPEAITNRGEWDRLFIEWAKREGHRKRVRMLGYEEAHR